MFRLSKSILPFFSNRKHLFQFSSPYRLGRSLRIKSAIHASQTSHLGVKGLDVAPWYDSGRLPQFPTWNLKTWLILHSELSFLTIPSFPYPSKRDFKSSVRELFAAFDVSICVLDDNFNLLILIK